MPYLESGDYITVRRGVPIDSTVNIGPSKHAGNAIAGALPLVEHVTVINPPPIRDFGNFLTIYEHLGTTVENSASGESILDNSMMELRDIPEEPVKKTRASILLLSAALLRTGKVEIPMPEGDWPGTRRSSSSLDIAREFGVEVNIDQGIISASLPKPEKQQLEVDVKGKVFSTLFSLIMATGLGGEYKIHNPLSSLEVDNLTEFLRSIGADISGLDTKTISVQSDGLRSLSSVASVSIDPDACETMFWLAYSNLHQIPLTVNFPNWNRQVSESNLGPLFDMSEFINRTHLRIQPTAANSFTILPQSAQDLRPIDVVPPYNDKKGQPRDAMPQLSVLFGALDIDHYYKDEKYSTRRTSWMEELKKIGAWYVYWPLADIGQIIGNGRGHYEARKSDTHLVGEDIRSAASLLLAASTCEQPVTLHGLSHIKRSYTDLLRKIGDLGTEIVDMSPGQEYTLNI